MWCCIYKSLEFFKITQEISFSDQFVRIDELSYQSKYKKPNFFFGEKQYDHLRQPLLDQIKGECVDDFKGVDQHHHQCDEKRVNMRVKIKMTKEEARRLVAKCKDQKGTLEFRDVALELVKIPPHRILEVATIESNTTTYPPTSFPFCYQDQKED